MDLCHVLFFFASELSSQTFKHAITYLNNNSIVLGNLANKGTFTFPVLVFIAGIFINFIVFTLPLAKIRHMAIDNENEIQKDTINFLELMKSCHYNQAQKLVQKHRWTLFIKQDELKNHLKNIKKEMAKTNL